MYPEGIRTISIKDQVQSDFLALLIFWTKLISIFWKFWVSVLVQYCCNSILILIRVIEIKWDYQYDLKTVILDFLKIPPPNVNILVCKYQFTTSTSPEVNTLQIEYIVCCKVQYYLFGPSRYKCILSPYLSTIYLQPLVLITMWYVWCCCNMDVVISQLQK